MDADKICAVNCSYSLFASISTLMKEDMVDILQPIIALMIRSIHSTEGIKVYTVTTFLFVVLKL